MTQNLIIQKAFSSVAKPLRQAFDANFADPRRTQPQRFVWDYWHVPGQYTALRTPAFQYFEPELYFKLHHEIVLWGRRTLGCWDISPPWMSCYIEGCHQELHSDVPHGPWAFVYSLTPAKNWAQRKFTGGETLLLKPQVLNYWQNFSEAKDRELGSFVDRIGSPFNQLTVFDPRYPHGVTKVQGTQNPAEGRLVIHGWFTEPKTYLEGALKSQAKKVERLLDQNFDRVLTLVRQAELEVGPLQGVLSLQIEVLPSGRVNGCRYATCNILDPLGQSPLRHLRLLKKLYTELEFPKSSGRTLVTVPLIFA